MLTIIRGLPGSGKSTYAYNNYKGIVILEADMLCMQDGKYIFESDKIKTHHNSIHAIVDIILSNNADCVITGTLTRKWEIEPYIRLAEKHNQKYQIIKLVNNYLTIHSVPVETIKTMKDRWEDINGEIVK
jgi:predicted kinase